MQIMHDSTSPQIKHILPDPTVAGAVALPTSNMCQGMFDGYALPQLGTPLRRLLACPQLLQQGFIGMNIDTPARGAGGASQPQRTTRTRGRGKLHTAAGFKGHCDATRTLQFVSLPIQLERTFGKIRPLVHRPGLAENGQRRGALLHQLTGQIGPVNVQFAQGTLLRCQVRFDYDLEILRSKWHKAIREQSLTPLEHKEKILPCTHALGRSPCYPSRACRRRLPEGWPSFGVSFVAKRAGSM
jgi:hypothetical protein